MEEVLNRLRGLTADELREEFARADLKCGPITATTRATFERKLARVLAGPGSNATESDSGLLTDSPSKLVCNANHTKPPSCADVFPAPASMTNSTLDEAANKEFNFGYGVGLNPPEEEAITVQTPSKSSADALSKTETPSKPAQVSPTFYGVCPPWEDVLSRNERVHVYTDKKQALQAVKMMKGARFKAFSNWVDAEKFAKGICEYYPSPNKSTGCLSPVKPGLVVSKGL